MSKRRSNYDSDSNGGSEDSSRKRSEYKSREKSSPKSKWESPEHDRGSRDRRRDRSYDRGETSHRHRNDDRNSRRDDDRSSKRDDYRRRDSPEHKKRRESPDDRRRRRDSPDNRRRRDSPDRRRGRNSQERNNYNHDRNRRNDDNPRNRKSNRNYDEKEYSWGNQKIKEDPDEAPPVEKEKPNFGLSGALAKEKNTVHGVEIKYAEPPEAKKPKRHWRLYQFKGDQSLPVLHIHRQSAYLIGRDRKICDMAIDHPSASKQHAVLQYRLVKYEKDDGTVGKRVRPYIIDLGSSNGTFLNNKKIDPSKYYELLEKDVLKFAFSSREYVLLHETSKEDDENGDEDDNVDEEQDNREEKTEGNEAQE